MYAYAKSIKGNELPVNGDFFVTDTIGDYTILIVADGLGGTSEMMNIGAIPSGIVMDYVERALTNRLDLSVSELKQALMDGVFAASRTLRTLNAVDARYQGVYASIACLAVSNLSNKMAYASIGNCEIQLWRNGQFNRMNALHTTAFDKLEQGKIQEADYYTQPERGLLTSAMGVFDDVKIDGHAGTLREGDILLLASDGVYRHLTPGDVMGALAESEDVQNGVDQVLQKISSFEDVDNATLICLFVE